MDHSHMDHGHMDHDMPGMGGSGPKCNMNVRTPTSFHPACSGTTCRLASFLQPAFKPTEPLVDTNNCIDAVYLGHDGPLHCFPFVAHLRHGIAYFLAARRGTTNGRI